VNLSFFQKPSRYINSEINSIRKQSPAREGSGHVSVALSFPDVYEVGMSHLGMKILYDVINKLPYSSAERVFSPWKDMDEYMKTNNILLSSLESNKPLKDFDIAGFSLQYELSYTTVLNMLYLGGIPHNSEDRFDSKKTFPVMVAGGPCTTNPAPMSAFIDAFLIGDGEDAVVELVNVVRQWKTEGDGKRETLLRMISDIEGFFVPYVYPYVDKFGHKRRQAVKRRFIADLNDSPYPVKPIVPYTAIVHDRINIEVSRGCTMGCRFCQAGMIYRPLREKSPERVLEIAELSLKHTGHDEVSLASLSAGDYSCLLKVIKDFNAKFGMSKIALSLPSLRVASVSREVLKEIKSVRKTGFTMAPEAATERLRSVINKDFSSDDYERALNALFAEGWLNLKLYFMIGLPTERDEDVEAIKDMAVKALQIAKKNTGRFVNISITVSPFVPKPHTPFQWFGRIGIDEIKRKQKYLREELGSKKFKYKGHDGNMSFLEAVFARGDEKLSALIEEAWQSGCRLDGWSEMFDFNKWLHSMDKTGIDGHFYTERAFCKDDILPWDYIDTGIKKSFLYKEYERALSEEKTEDCKKVCTACGLKCVERQARDALCFTHDAQRLTLDASRIKVRVQFSKTGKLRYLSHLELATVILRGLRRANVPLNYSKGFHPSPRVSFSPPLGVGIAGEREYFDMEVFEPFDVEFYMKQLNNTLPEGIKISKMVKIIANEQSLNSFISRYEYNIKVSGHKAEIKPEFKGSIIVQRDRKSIDISPCIEDIKILSEHFAEDRRAAVSYSLILRDHEGIKVRIGEMVKALFGIEANEVDITRTALYGRKGKDEGLPEGWNEPL